MLRKIFFDMQSTVYLGLRFIRYVFCVYETYSYDSMGNITALTRQGWLYNTTWGLIDDLTMAYDGNRLVKCDDDVSAQPTYNGAHHFQDLADSAVEYEYDGNGNMVKDLNRNITSIEYNSLNLPEQITFYDGTKMKLTYDAAGNKLRAEYWTIGTFNPGGPIGPASLGGGAEPQGGGIVGPILLPINQNDSQVVTDYCGNVIYRNDTLSMLLTEEGYVTFDERGEPLYHYYLKDHLGSVRQVIEAEGTDQGTIVQKMNYYPSGLQFCNNVTDSDVQPRRYNGKEYDKMHGLNTYDYGARQYNPVTARWDRMDPLCEKYYGISPYAYCGGNPMNAVDPDGCVIQGVTQKDASMAVKNIREMFVGDVFDNFRELIQQSGKNHDKETLAHISKEALNNAFDGINLSEDQKALVDMVVNTINSSDIHMIEYADNNKVISNVGKEAFSSELAKAGLPVSTIVKKNGGIPTKIISAFGGGGLTVQTEKGTHSVIVNETRLHPNGIAVTTGHEIIGHGRSLASGRGKERQHVDAVRTENLILRVMGINYINDGSNHGPGTVIKDPSMLPDFR